METKFLSKKDAIQVALLHKKAFSGFFLTGLGVSFLSVFYQSIFRHHKSIKIGLFDDQKLIGFAVGAKNSKSFYSSILKKNFIYLASSAFFPLLFNPLKIYRLFKSLTSQKKTDETILDDAILLSICVDPTSKTKGYGKILLSNFEKVAFKFSALISLTTDAENNDKVNSFYAKNGYELHNSFYQGKRKMNCYIKKLKE
jgi:ribosomal protein S18 acetylase RimI-like enzyme